MLWWFFKRHAAWFTPRWLGREAFRSGVRMEDCPYTNEVDISHWQVGWKDEQLLASHGALGPAFSPDDWRACLFLFAIEAIFVAAVVIRILMQ